MIMVTRGTDRGSAAVSNATDSRAIPRELALE